MTALVFIDGNDLRAAEVRELVPRATITVEALQTGAGPMRSHRDRLASGVKTDVPIFVPHGSSISPRSRGPRTRRVVREAIDDALAHLTGIRRDPRGSASIRRSLVEARRCEQAYA